MTNSTTGALSAFVTRRKESPNGAGHYHIAERYPYKIRILIMGVEVASTTEAIILKEVGTSVYNPSFYIPRNDVRMDRLEAVEGNQTRCPIKGTASYWTFSGGDENIPNAAWSYDDPLPYSEMIREHLGFDQRYATIEISPVLS